MANVRPSNTHLTAQQKDAVLRECLRFTDIIIKNNAKREAEANQKRNEAWRSIVSACCGVLDRYMKLVSRYRDRWYRTVTKTTVQNILVSSSRKVKQFRSEEVK